MRALASVNFAPAVFAKRMFRITYQPLIAAPENSVKNVDVTLPVPAAKTNGPILCDVMPMAFEIVTSHP